MIDHLVEAERRLKAGADSEAPAKALAHAMVDIAHTLRALLIEVRTSNVERTQAMQGVLSKALGGVSQMFGNIQVVPPQFMQESAEDAGDGPELVPPDGGAPCTCKHTASVHVQFDGQCLMCDACHKFELTTEENANVDR